MTLSETIRARQAHRATRENRAAQAAAEVRIDEIGAVSDVAADYAIVDRAGDVQIETHFQKLYALVDSEAEREAVAAAYAVWMRTERAEDLAVSGSVEQAVNLLRSNNPFWLSEHTGSNPRWVGQAKDLTRR